MICDRYKPVMAKYIILNLMVFFTLAEVMPAQAMLSDGAHQQQDYQNLAYENAAFESACQIVDHKGQISQTGVLVDHNVVATAAHGVIEMIKNRQLTVKNDPLYVDQVQVVFIHHGQLFTVDVDCVLVDARYTENSGLQAKHDVALIKLKNSIYHIQPAKIFTTQIIPDQALLTVVSFGMADQPHSPTIKRAFRLFERDTYHLGGLDDEELAARRSLLQSSLFFKPNEKLTQPSEHADEETIRVFEATQNWLKADKKAYALALPGTSGAPVFVRMEVNGKTEEYLFGIVTSFAHLSGRFQAPKGQPEHEYILRYPQLAFNNYQTIFALFYQEDTNPLLYNKKTKSYFLDPSFIKLFERIKRF